MSGANSSAEPRYNMYIVSTRVGGLFGDKVCACGLALLDLLASQQIFRVIRVFRVSRAIRAIRAIIRVTKAIRAVATPASEELDDVRVNTLQIARITVLARLVQAC